MHTEADVYVIGDAASVGIKNAEVPTQFVKQYEKLLAGGIWCIITVSYFYEEGQKGSPFIIEELKPIQMPNVDLAVYFAGR